ncbi:MAG: response regulator [Nitrospiraceae bacterium]|nr:response regulator [Nitrospiraceae bacterium]
MDGYGKRVLVVDGDEDLRCAVGAVLESARYVVHLAVEAGEVFSEVQKRRFDVIVVGVHVPLMDGARLVRLGRALCPNTPIIFVSAELSPLDEQVELHSDDALPFGELDRLRLQATVRAAASVCGRPPFLEVQA